MGGEAVGEPRNVEIGETQSVGQKVAGDMEILRKQQVSPETQRSAA